MAIKSTSFLKRKIYTKHEIIKEIVKDKKVIHYGCVDDDKKLIKQKFEEGYYLHKIVTDSSKETIGVEGGGYMDLPQKKAHFELCVQVIKPLHDKNECIQY